MTPKIFFHLNSHKIFFWLFALTLLFQILFWQKVTKNISPNFDIVPPAPNKYLTEVLSLGDKEFLFRVLGARLQNSGDVFAGFAALKRYDYPRIYNWMKLLDTLNSESNFIPSLASYYYSQTQNTPDTKYVIDYLDEHASKNIDKKWWWLFQAIYVAKKNLKDEDRALELAYKLSTNNAKDAPFWTKQMPAFIYKDQGEDCLAFRIIEKTFNEAKKNKIEVKPEDINFMRFFINQRIENLKKKNFDPNKCQKDL